MTATLPGLPAARQSFVVLAQPGIAANQLQNDHPERLAQARVAQRDGGPSRESFLARLPNPRDYADVARDRAGAVKSRRISELCDKAGRSQRPHAFDGHDQLGDLMLVHSPSDVARQVLQPMSEQLQILTQILDSSRYGSE